MRFAYALNQVARAAISTQGTYPDEELFGEILDMHYWLLGNFRVDIFGNISEFVHIEPGQVNLTPVVVQIPNRAGINPL
jgi:hypothetical protein